MKKSSANKGMTPWNKNKKIRWEIGKCEHCGEPIEYLKSKPKRYHQECWKKASGGYRKGSGIGKSGWYKGTWCDSSYELAWVIYQLDHGIEFKRNKEKFKYEWKGKILSYIPDFIQGENIIEIKGFMNEQSKEKIKNIKNLKMLFRKDLNVEFNYVENKYGKNFTSLYEK